MRVNVFSWEYGQPEIVGYYQKISNEGVFVYGDSWKTKRAPLPTMNYEKPFHLCDTNEGIHGPLRDALPDMWGRLVMSKTEKIPFDDITSAQLMVFSASASRVGCLDFSISDEIPKEKLPSFNDLLDYLDISDMIERNIDSEMLKRFQLLKPGTSMGGARPKITVENNDIAYLIKMPSRNDRIDNALLEFSCLKLARNVGIVAPDFEVISVGNKNILSLKRFDREGEKRKGYISALSLLLLDEKESMRGSYSKIADQLPEQHKSEMFKRMCLNVSIRNTDDHMRNHGFFHEKGKIIQPTPMFDLAPSQSIVGVGSTFYQAIECGKEGRYASAQNLISEHERFNISYDEAVKMMINISTQVRDEWRETFRNSGLDVNEILSFEGCFDNDFHNSVDSFLKRANAISFPSSGEYSGFVTDINEDGFLIKHSGRKVCFKYEQVDNQEINIGDKVKFKKSANDKQWKVAFLGKETENNRDMNPPTR